MYKRKYMVVLFNLLVIVILAGGCGGEGEKPMAPTIVPPTDVLSEGEKEPQSVPDIAWLRSTNKYGHTGIKIQNGEQIIYLDPVDLVSLEGLPKADVILISHDHGDHFSPQTISALITEDTKIVSIESITSQLGGGNTYSLSPGQKIDVDGLEVEGIPAYNANHPKGLGYLGFILSINGIKIYMSGDTGLNPEMESLSEIDTAVLNVRVPFSLSGEDAVAFAEKVQPGMIIPIHWMPEDDTYNDRQEIEYLQRNIPDTIELTILELE